MPRPLGHVGHPDAAFKHGQFPASVGLVDVGQPDVARRTVVAAEHHQCVLVQTFFFKGFQNAAHAAIDGAHHGRIHPHAVVRDVRQRVVIGLAGLQRRVHAPMREVHKERAVLVAPDGSDCLIGVVVGQVLGGLKPRTALVTDAKAHVGPQKLVDRIEILLGVPHIG